jgi:hypothetical protein
MSDSDQQAADFARLTAIFNDPESLYWHSDKPGHAEMRRQIDACYSRLYGDGPANNGPDK